MNLDFGQIWLLIGAALLGIEFLIPLPTVFIPGALGVGAILTSVIAFFFPIPIGGQIIVWLIFSAGFIWYSRKWLMRNSPTLRDASIGVTTTEILAGQSGRVKCDGVSWRAICDDPTLSIGANVPVQIVRKNGTTLIILPEKYIDQFDFLKPQDREKEL